MAAWSATVALQTMLRFRLVGEAARLSGRVWRLRMESILLAGGAIWGLMAAWAVSTYGFSSTKTMGLLIYHAAIAVVGGPVFIHSIRRMRLFLALLFVPALLTSAVSPVAQPLPMVCAFLLYGVFLSVRGQWLSEHYLRDLADYARLSTTARVDSLTGLPNRQAIQEVLAREVEAARECGAAVGLMFIDLDGFKAVNDRHSHRVGDLLLCEVAQRLRGCAEGGEFVGRLGGDEFLVVLTGGPGAVTQRSLRERSLEIVSLLMKTATIEGIVCGVGASMGTALFPEDANDEDHLVRAADQAMYEAKRAGTNEIRAATRQKERATPEGGLGHLAAAVERLGIDAATAIRPG